MSDKINDLDHILAEILHAYAFQVFEKIQIPINKKKIQKKNQIKSSNIS